MKKIIMLFALIMGCLSMSAQKNAYFESKALDNVYVGVNGGAYMPLSMNSVFPLNAQGSIRVGKDFTPIFGAFVEGTAIFGDNVGWNHHACYSHTFVKASNVGLNGTINWMNLCCGYKGMPRTFEVVSVAGLGWFHTYGNNTGFENNKNDLSAKTAVDLIYNFSNKWQLVVEPGVFWNLTATDDVIFNKNFAQLGLNVGVNYKFKTSNGTHNFRCVDIDALNDRLNYLIAENEALKNQKPKVITKVVDRNFETIVDRVTIVSFAQNSDELTSEADLIIKGITAKKVSVVGFASPEGTTEYNQKLSESRANVVKKALESNGIEVVKAEGMGAVNNTSNRIVKIIAQ